MSNIFRLAIKHIPTDPSHKGADGICAAIEKAYLEEGLSYRERTAAKAIIGERLGRSAWVTGWLCTHQPGFRKAWDEAWTKHWDRKKYKASPLWKEVQAYRVRWCEHLADEVDAGRIKL